MEKIYLEELKKKIDNDKQLSLCFGTSSKLYSMTTENILGFLSHYNLEGKKVLTVAGSGDQRLNAYLMGAKEVKTFDINPFAKYHLELKDEAIKSINFEKFINFFGISSKRYGDYYKPLDIRIYEEFCGNLSDETKSIFDYIINNNIPFHSIYYSFPNKLSDLSKMNLYLLRDEYERLRTLLNTKVDFICSNVTELKERLNGETFDMILLSNISDYIEMFFEEDYLKQYRELIDSLSDNLNENGVIQVGYIYSMYDKNSYKSQFSMNYIRQNYFPSSIFETIMVDAFDEFNRYTYDKVITYTKKKR